MNNKRWNTYLKYFVMFYVSDARTVYHCIRPHEIRTYVHIYYHMVYISIYVTFALQQFININLITF